ncbi:MAG: hypothetical protein HGA85_04795 [Nanoarchaeota archaeon]|nr:hypothetical protein [Nanoarchaeota archaeon]
MPNIDNLLKSLEDILDPSEKAVGDDVNLTGDYDPISLRIISEKRRKIEKLLNEAGRYRIQPGLNRKNRTIAELVYKNLDLRARVIDTRMLQGGFPYEACFAGIGSDVYSQLQEYRAVIEANGRDLTEVAGAYLAYLRNIPKMTKEYIGNNMPVVQYVDEENGYLKELLIRGYKGSIDENRKLVRFSLAGLYHLLLYKGAVKGEKRKLAFENALAKAKASLRTYREIVEGKRNSNSMDNWVIGLPQLQDLFTARGYEGTIAQLADEAKSKLNSTLEPLEELMYELRPRLRRSRGKKTPQERWQDLRSTIDDMIAHDKISTRKGEKARCQEVVAAYQRRSDEYILELRRRFERAGEREIADLIGKIEFIYRPIPKEERPFADVYALKGEMGKTKFKVEIFINPFDPVMNCVHAIEDTVAHETMHGMTSYMDYILTQKSRKGKRLKRLLFDFMKDEGMTTNMEDVSPEILKDMSVKSRLYQGWAAIRVYSRALADIATLIGDPEYLKGIDAVPIQIKSRGTEEYMQAKAYKGSARLYGFFEIMSDEESIGNLASYASSQYYTASTYFLGKRAVNFKNNGRFSLKFIAHALRNGTMPVYTPLGFF